MATSYLLKNSHLWKGVKPLKERLKEEKAETTVYQQSDYLKEFMLTIINDGLAKAYADYGDNPPGPSPPVKSTSYYAFSKVDYDVIIIGAGMAGLSAAHELKKAGLKVKIVEQTERFGGRVFTYDEKDGLAPGLYGEAGAMRLPGDVNNPEDRAHFLTDGYIKKFELPIKKFPNYDENGLTHIYDLKKKSTDWGSEHFLDVWPQWKEGIKEDMIEVITNIDEYYEKTTAVVTDHLIKRLEKTKNVDEEINVWDHWIDIWSQFTLESFLESNIGVIKAKIPAEDQADLDMKTLGKLLPWSNDAVRGYSVSSYTEQLDQSLVQYLRDQLGKWWSENMHTLRGGMHSLPKAFFDKGVLCKEDVAFKRQVSKITYRSCLSSPKSDYVEVTCYPNENETTPYTCTAKAVIITAPVNVLRQITFVPLLDDDDTKLALRKNIQAIEDIYTGPATKVIVQTKTRFWEKEPYKINGGFSKTSLPIGQIHYVRPENITTKQGIILIYTWKNEALIFGSLTPEQVKQEVVEEIAEIHPEITTTEGEVEACIVHAWYNQPSYQGAYGLMKTTQFNNIRYLWDAMGNVHFSGENLSFAPGWIQGALESGLKSAYQVYARYRQRNDPETKA